MSVIDNPGGEFNSSTSGFTIPIRGLYKITYTATVTRLFATSNPNNYVFGLMDSTNQWVMRYSISDSGLVNNNTNSGIAYTFVGLAELNAGAVYYFGVSGRLRLLANPTGSTGSGLGSYFEIELIKNL